MSTIREFIAIQAAPTWKQENRDAIARALHPEVLALPVDSGCGADCLTLIVMGLTLLDQMADIDAPERAGVANAVAAQCRVFYFG